jgi:hypothetical protein
MFLYGQNLTPEAPETLWVIPRISLALRDFFWGQKNPAPLLARKQG